MSTTQIGFDTINEQAALSMADRVLHHARTTGRPQLDSPSLAAARLGDRGMFINCGVVLERPDEWPSVLDQIAEVIPPGTPATLISRYETPDLTPLGWTLIGHPPLMLRIPGAAAAPPVPVDLQIREVVDGPGLEVFERTLVDGYPMPALQPYKWGCFYDEPVLGGPTRFWVGFVDGRPVATAAAHVAAGVNNVEMVATLDGWRGKGFGAAVTWAATTADPTLPAILIASDLGRPVYERLGYTALTRWTMWLRP
jgi:GNAT superfamily N-acetyltransferase